MPRRLTIAVLAIGAALLFATGALAALLISGDVGGGSKASGTGKGYIGATVALSLGQGLGQGLQVRSVDSDGPAARAGIQVGDYIRSVDGQVVRTPEQLRNAVESKAPGTSVTVTYERGDRQLQATVKLAEARADAQIEAPPGPAGQPQARGGPGENRGQLGVQIQNITPQLKQRYNLTRDSGVVVTEVQPNSAGADAGLKAGDVVLAVNGANVSTAIELTRLLAGTAGQPVSLKVLRGSDELTITVTPRAAELFPGFDRLPQELQQRLRDLAQNRNITPEQLQRLAGGDRLSVPGTVKDITPTSITISPVGGGNDQTFDIDRFTFFGRFLDQVSSTDVKQGSTVLVLSSDGRTAAAVLMLKQ